MPEPQPQSVDQLLQAMVRIDSVSPNISSRPDAEVPLAKYLESLAQQWGLATRRLPVDPHSFNLLIASEASPSKRWLMLESHLDTVGVDGMTIAPFGGEIRDGKLFGRGAGDTTATGAAMLWALQQYPTQANRPYNAAVLFVGGEETVKTGAVAFAEKQLPTLGFKPAGMVIGEPTMLRAVVAHNGVVRLQIETTGVACHSSNPANGKSAIRMMMPIIDAIESRYAPSLAKTTHPLTGRAQCSVNIIHGGTLVNIIPERCQITVDRRLVPGENLPSVVPTFQRLLDDVRREHPEIVAKVLDDVFLDPSLDPSGAGGLIGHASNVLRILGLNPEPYGEPYGTDASTYCDAGVPAIVLGPGDIKQAHTKDEWITLDQLRLGANVYLALLTTPMEATR
jgi:acetylornithine deacetylase